MLNINESSELSKGIFWIKDIDNIKDSIIYFDIPCNSNGDIESNEFVSNAKSGNTYNHENTWKELSSNITDNLEYNYFPRGRIEISNSKAIIYCSPYIANDELVNVIIDKFNLYKHNGITKIQLKADGSNHYKCYLD